MYAADANELKAMIVSQVINKGMTKDVVKNNGQVAKKMVKESEDKKANGEEIVDKQVSCNRSFRLVKKNSHAHAASWSSC